VGCCWGGGPTPAAVPFHSKPTLYALAMVIKILLTNSDAATA